MLFFSYFERGAALINEEFATVANVRYMPIFHPRIPRITVFSDSLPIAFCEEWPGITQITWEYWSAGPTSTKR